MNYQKNLKAIPTKGLTKDLINKFSIINGAEYFSSGIFQNNLAFIPDKKQVKYFRGTTQIISCKSNEMSGEYIENTTKSDSNFAPTFLDHHVLSDIDVNGHCLINIVSVLKKVINLYISYILNPCLRNLNLLHLVVKMEVFNKFYGLFRDYI